MRFALAGALALIALPASAQIQTSCMQNGAYTNCNTNLPPPGVNWGLAQPPVNVMGNFTAGVNAANAARAAADQARAAAQQRAYMDQQQQLLAQQQAALAQQRRAPADPIQQPSVFVEVATRAISQQVGQLIHDGKCGEAATLAGQAAIPAISSLVAAACPTP